MTKLRITPLRIVTLALAAQCSLAVAADPTKKTPLKVYILAGQSNMVGMANASTLEHIKLLPESAKEFKDMFDKDGKPVVMDDVWITFGERKGKLAPIFGGAKAVSLGPEYAFGVYMHKALQEPILLIKAAYGGKSLSFDFRPPSAGEWTPPPGHPDLIKEEPVKLPIPTKLDLPADYVPGEEILPKHARRLGAFMGIRPMQGVSIGEVNGVYPIYIAQAPTEKKLEGNPFQVGDVIIGVNGQGLRKDSIDHWREAFFGEFGEDWMLSVTRWRKGKIETFDLDLSYRLEDGRAGIDKAKEESKKSSLAAQEGEGRYYKLMLEEIQKALGDIKSIYPDYDPEQGYELAGFVWFQGWNDVVNSYAYPNREKPRGFEQYGWLLKHFIRDVRKDLKAPELPFVIGAIGVGGYQETPRDRFGHLQQAMAAPAEDPEFKGTVATVQTGNYWDKQLEELINRSSEIAAHKSVLQRENGLEGEALAKAYAEYRAGKMSPLEEEILKKGASNKGFHYLGSAKILSGIGKGFAEAMLKLQDKTK